MGTHHAYGLISAVAALSVAAPALARSPNHICATFDPSTKTMTVHVATGCKSSSLRYLGHDLKVTAITGTPVLELSGAFKYRRPKGKRYKRDCAARKKADIELHNVEPRRYIVVANGERVGIFDFTQSPERVCASASRSPIRYLPPI